MGMGNGNVFVEWQWKCIWGMTMSVEWECDWRMGMGLVNNGNVSEEWDWNQRMGMCLRNVNTCDNPFLPLHLWLLLHY